VHAAVARQDVLVKVFIPNLVSLRLDVKLQETQEKAEKTAADVVVASDKLEAPETPESILLGRQRGNHSRDRTDRVLLVQVL
jgi:hypothetical protein